MKVFPGAEFGISTIHGRSRLGQIAVFFVQKTQKSGTKNCIMPDF